MKRYGSMICLLFCSYVVLADDEPAPALQPTPELAAMRYCQIAGVRAAWGAWSRYHGSPSTFRYAPPEEIKAYFFAVDTPRESSIPTDGIYTATELEAGDQRWYEEFAFYGWKQADRWIKEGRPYPKDGFEGLVAVLYAGCKAELTKQGDVRE